MTSLQEFEYIVPEGKSQFATHCKTHIELALKRGHLPLLVYEEMLKDCQKIAELIAREKGVDQVIKHCNQQSKNAQRLDNIPGIGPINASVLDNKPMELYENARDFAASLGLVPKQHTTGGRIHLGSITKQGDRYARTMLIQAGRTLVMRTAKPRVPQDPIYPFIERLKKAGKGFNVICVAVANKLARIAYACTTRGLEYNALPN